MAHRCLVAAVSIACASLPWTIVAPAGGTAATPIRAQPAVHPREFWQESESTTFATRTADAICADLNGDGWPELTRLGIALGSPYGGTLGITLGGVYGPQGPEIHLQPLPSPRSVRAVDLNGDGLMDLIAAHMRPVPNIQNGFVHCATMFVQTGRRGAGGIDFVSPAPSIDLAPGGEILLLRDVDQDQIVDLVSVGSAHRLYYQRGLGLSLSTPAVPLFQAVAINISELAAQTAGLPAGSSFNFGFANDLAGGDFDGDGSTDLAVAAGSVIGGGVHVYYLRPTGWMYQGFAIPYLGFPGAASITSLACGDFDGDGLDDLVATSPSLDLLTLLNNGSGAMHVDATASAGMRAVTSPGVLRNSIHAVSADFNGDGLTDIACLDVTLQKITVAYNPSTNFPAGVFSALPGHFGAFDLPGSGLRALDAVDIDLDGDVDLVGSYMFSQSTAVLSNERMANARKPTSATRLRGASTSSALSDAFVPDALEFEQWPNAFLMPNLAAHRFAFQASAIPGERIRLRVHLRAHGPGVSVRFGLVDVATGRVRWVHSAAVATNLQEIVVIVPEAVRHVSGSGRLELFVLSVGSSGAFRTAIDQLSAEVIP